MVPRHSIGFGHCSAIGHPASTPLEHGFALLDECLRRIAAIFGLPAVHVMGRFEIQTVVEVAGRNGAMDALFIDAWYLA